MKKLLATIAALTVLISNAALAQTNKELEQIKHSYVKMILFEDRTGLDTKLFSLPKENNVSDRMPVELMQRYPIDYSRVETIMNNIGSDNAWADIDYLNRDRSGWVPKEYPERILLMAKAYQTKDSPLYHNSQLLSVINRAMDYWFDKKMVCPNWWYNEIGVPKTLGDAFMLLDQELSGKRRDQAIELLKKSKIGRTGQNKVWLSGIVLVRATLQNDYELASAARNAIISEVVVSDSEGIKTDFSFHQHGPQQQFGNYGAAYVSSMSFWSQALVGTSLAFDQSSLDIISRLMNQGYRKVLWHGYLDINGLGRQFFRQSQMHKGLTAGFAAQGLARVDTINRSSYNELVTDNFAPASSGTTARGLYHFWQSDQTVQRRSQWMASVKMHSTRAVGTEAGNGDNLQGYHLSDGAQYTYVDGDEYDDIFPCWNWRLIPGTTCYDSDAPLKLADFGSNRGTKNFVGSVNDSNVGMTVMDFEKDGLTARKAWIFTDDYVLCLGAGINSDSDLPVRTSIDQVNKKSNPQYLSQGRWKAVEGKYSWDGQQPTRLLHNKMGYIVMGHGKGEIQSQTVTGSWSSVMSIYDPKDTLTKDVVSLWISHGTRPSDGSYQYLILPATTAQKVKDFNTKNIFTISNSPEIQVVSILNLKRYFIAAYAPSGSDLGAGIRFHTSDPGLFMIENNKDQLTIYVADPTQKLDSISVTINSRTREIELPKDKFRGTTTKYIWTLN